MGALTSWNPQGLSRPVMGLLYLVWEEEVIFSGGNDPIFRVEEKIKGEKVDNGLHGVTPHIWYCS